MFKVVVNIKVAFRDGETDNKEIEFFIYDCKQAEDAIKMAYNSLTSTDEFRSLSFDFDVLDVNLRLITPTRTEEGVFFIPSI